MSMNEDDEALDDIPLESVPGASDSRPLSISQLNFYIKQLVEEPLRRIWTTGEISDLSRPSSGHIYFTLKDSQSQIRAVVWRTTAQRLPFALKDGLKVICCGNVEVYAPRGSYQIIINQVQPAGHWSASARVSAIAQKAVGGWIVRPSAEKADSEVP